MANKKITIEVDVDTKKVDDAVAKTGKLKDLGKGLKIQYDIDGKPVDVVIDKTLNLQKQVKLLTAELRRTKEGTAEFTLLSNKLNDAKDDLGRVTAKSNELFGSLSLLPGPVGQFASTVQGALDVLKTFSGFKLSDFRNQFKALGNDLSAIGSNFFGYGKVIEEAAVTNTVLSQSQKEANSSVDEGKKIVEDATVQNVSYAQSQKQVAESIKSSFPARENQILQAGKVVDAEQAMVRAQQKSGQSLANMTVAQQQSYMAQRKLAVESLKLGTATFVAADSQKVLGDASTVAAVKTGLLGRGLKSLGAALGIVQVEALAASSAVILLDTVLAALGIGLIIAVVVGLGSALFDVTKKLLGFRTETEENIAATDAFTAALKREEEALGLDLEAIDLSTKALETRAKIANKSEKDILEITKQGGKDRLQALRDYDEVLYKEQKDLASRKNLTTEQSEKLNKEINDKIIANGRAINKQIMQNEQTNLDGRLTLRESYKNKSKLLLTNELADIEAKIKLEIDKEKTGKDELEKLLNKKLELRKKIEGIKNNSAQEKVIIAENKKLLNDSLIDDTERTIQAEIDKNNRLAIESGIGTKELFEAKKKMAQEQFLFELKEAERDEKTKNNKIENARTKYWKTLIDIDKEALDARIKLDQEKFNAQYEGTEKFFELQRQLELDNYAKQQADARDNYDQLEAIKQTHQKKLIAIDIAELQYKAGLEKRKAETEQENYTKVEDRFMESFAVIKDLNTRKYQDLRNEEDLAYQADLLAAGDNTLKKEQIEREHAAKMRQIGADEVEAKKQTTLAIQNVTQQFGQVIGQIGDLMMQEAQGRDKKMFEAGKKAAIAGIAIDKISAIASIITNTAIANAKAVAAFPLTLGQPWVTINTVSAGLSIAATIAAGISAISQLNGQKFEAAGSGTGGATSPGNQLGRNYEKGGIINGKRHAEGGTMIEAEKGEAIMTRGAVTAFSPLLSMMNQMGGGTSFTQGAVGQAGFDNPKVATPSQEQTPMIVKTYVVSTDMTSEQNKQARLKNLSTL